VAGNTRPDIFKLIVPDFGKIQFISKELSSDTYEIQLALTDSFGSLIELQFFPRR